MDWLETLLPLIIFFFYFLSQLGKRRRKETRPTAPEERLSTAEKQGAAPTPFEELIRQIQQAAEEAEAARQPEAAKPPPPARPTPRPRLQPAPPKKPTPAAPAPAEFRPVGGFDHDRHGFGPDSPFSEEAFERLARGADVTEHAPGHLDYSPHASPSRPGQPSPKQPHPLAERLRRPGSAREAFALREVLDAPRARRPR